MRHVALALALVCSGCVSLFNVDSEIVNTPLHDDTRVFYFNISDPEDEPPEQVELIASDVKIDADAGKRVENGDPVSIVINKVVLPRHLFDTTAEEAANRETLRKSYDIAVVVDVAAVEGQDKESIAVFYQRGVRANTALSFENLTVYSQDTWDNRVPPYFRVRIFNVSNERNERTRELLEQVEKTSGTLTSLVGLPTVEPLMAFAARAAELVMRGDNEMLVDFQFQLYSAAQTSESGGMPLGLFRKGGMLVVGIPRHEQRQYWGGKSFQYDRGTDEVLATIGDDGAYDAIDVPFLKATVMTTDVVVPNVVKKRSQEVFTVLRNTDALNVDFENVSNALTRLDTSVKALREREKFAKNPTAKTLKDYVDAIVGSETGDHPSLISDNLMNWLLATLRGATGVRLSSAAEYQKWLEVCGSLPFDAENRRFDLTGDDVPPACKDGSAGQAAEEEEEEEPEPDEPAGGPATPATPRRDQ